MTGAAVIHGHKNDSGLCQTYQTVKGFKVKRAFRFRCVLNVYLYGSLQFSGGAWLGECASLCWCLCQNVVTVPAAALQPAAAGARPGAAGGKAPAAGGSAASVAA